MRVAVIIQIRIQRGARHRFIRCINRWSRRSMYPQTLRATAIASPHPDGRKQASAFNQKDAYIGEKDFSRVNCPQIECFAYRVKRRFVGLAHNRPQPARLVPKLESISQSIRGCFLPSTMSLVHFSQKRISFIQWPRVNAGTRTASGEISSTQGLSQRSALMME